MNTRLIKSSALLLCLFLVSKVFSQAPSWEWITTGGDNSLGVGNYAYSCINDNSGNTFLAVRQGDTLGVQKFDQNGALVWTTKVFQKNVLNKMSDISVDSDGNIYVVGDFRDTCFFGSIMLIASPGCSYCSAGFLAKLDANGTFVWAIKGNESSRFESIVVDQNNDIIVGGYVGNNMALEIAGLTIPNLSVGKHLFVAKINSSGVGVWGKVFEAAYPSAPSGSDCSVNDITVDNSGNIYFTGTLNAGVSSNFGGITLSTSGPEVYVAKLDANGTIGWVKKSTSALSYKEASGQGIGVDVSGNVYMACWIEEDISFGSSTVTYGTTITGFNTIGLLKFDSNGVEQWVKGFGAVNNDYSTQKNLGFAVSSNGDVFLASNLSAIFFGTLDFGDGFSTFIPNNSKNLNYVVKINSSGVTQWAKINNSSIGDDFNNLSLDASGNVYVCGSWIEGLGYDNLFPPSGNKGIFLGKLGTSVSNSVNEEVGFTAVDFLVFPNPATDVVTISKLPEGSQLRIFDLTGRLMYQTFTPSDQIIISTADWSQGIYQISVEKDNFSYQRKMVIHK